MDSVNTAFIFSWFIEIILHLAVHFLYVSVFLITVFFNHYSQSKAVIYEQFVIIFCHGKWQHLGRMYLLMKLVIDTLDLKPILVCLLK